MGRAVVWCMVLGFCGCDGSLLNCAESPRDPNRYRGTWLGSTLALSWFDEASAHEIPERWGPIRVRLAEQDGYIDSHLYAAAQSRFPYLNLGVWESPRALAQAIESPDLAVLSESGAATSIYDAVEHRGDVREPGRCLAVVRLTSSEDTVRVQDAFRTASEWFGQKAGFVGAVLLRKQEGPGPHHVVVSRWASAEAFGAVSADRDFPLHAGGDGDLSTYLPVQP